LIAALLTIPVAGTALYIMDQYFNPRNLAAFAGIFAATRILKKNYLAAVLWVVFAAAVHPLMAAFAASFCVLLVAMEKLENKRHSTIGAARLGVALGCLLPFGISLDPPTSQAYHEAAMQHGFHYIQLWHWYEVLGAIAPAALFLWFGRIAKAREWNELQRVCRALVIYDVVYFAAALVVDLPKRFESLARLQPLRSLHLLYMILFIVMGGLLGEYFLKNRAWRWLALFLPLSAGMFAAQRALFPASPHLELPGMAPRNPWGQAFIWVRDHTPIDALVALDPFYLRLPGEDSVGFRCLALRSRMVDVAKDSGAVSMFPPLADDWWNQMQDLRNWKNFHVSDFERLKQKYGVSWVIVQQSGPPGLDCPYANRAVKVCRVP
jgi:hypothetical protein